MTKYVKTDVVVGDNVKSDVNVQLGLIENSLGTMLSRDGDLPNSMGADFDLNSNDILNGGHADFSSLSVGGAGVGGSGVGEAPSDGTPYSRQDAGWVSAALGGSGETNTASNSGAGEGLALTKVGADLPFKTLLATGGATLSSDATTVTIDAAGAGGISDAPVDGSTYARLNAAWSALTLSGGASSVETTATAAQTVFTAPLYTLASNEVEVYVNGVRQAPSLFTEASTTSVALSSGAEVGDLVEVRVNDFSGAGGVAGLEDAPSDGIQYARENGAWTTTLRAVSGETITAPWDFSGGLTISQDITIEASFTGLVYKNGINDAWDLYRDLPNNDFIIERFDPATGLTKSNNLWIESSTGEVNIDSGSDRSRLNVVNNAGAASQIRLIGDTGVNAEFQFESTGTGKDFGLRRNDVGDFQIRRYTSDVFQSYPLQIEASTGDLRLGWAGDAVHLDGDVEVLTGDTWNSVNGTFSLGPYRLWVDASGRLRIKNGTPLSDTDGTIVGVQS